MIFSILLGLLVGSAGPAWAGAPVVLHANQWFGGNGVAVCRSSTDPTCDGEQHVGGRSGNWWQCVELAQRFYKAKGWYGGIFPGVDYAYQIYDKAGSLGMSRQANGSIASLRPGDMIVHGPNASPYDGGTGHVAIVDSIKGSTLNVVEQNGSSTGRATYTLSNGSLTRSGLVNIRGVVHDPDNKGIGGPFGHFDTLERAPGGARISGWAIDPDTTGAIRVDTYGGTGSPGGGNPGKALMANVYRPDVGKVYPKYGPNHGYDGKIGLPYGSHKVCSYAINVGPGSNKQIGCKSINISPDPFGNLEIVKAVAGGVEVQGWSIDPDTASSIQVHLYGGSGSPGGGNPGKALVADVSRPDVARHYGSYGDRHGYEAFFALPAGEHKVCAYGINATNTSGSNKQIGCKDVYVSPDPFGNLDSVTPVDGGVQVSGWAIDPDTTSPIRVDVYGGDGGATPGVNPGEKFTANVSRPDVGRVYPRYGDLHGYAGFFALKSGQQTVCAYAINASGTPGSNKKIGCKTVTVP
jgi:hypothetical protein